jgi:hypothetical protein
MARVAELTHPLGEQNTIGQSVDFANKVKKYRALGATALWHYIPYSQPDSGQGTFLRRTAARRGQES